MEYKRYSRGTSFEDILHGWSTDWRGSSTASWYPDNEVPDIIPLNSPMMAKLLRRIHPKRRKNLKRWRQRRYTWRGWDPRRGWGERHGPQFSFNHWGANNNWPACRSCSVRRRLVLLQFDYSIDEDLIQVGCIMYNLVDFIWQWFWKPWLWSENPELGWLWTHREFLSLKKIQWAGKGEACTEADTSWLYYLPDEDQEE